MKSVYRQWVMVPIAVMAVSLCVVGCVNYFVGRVESPNTMFRVLEIGIVALFGAWLAVMLLVLLETGRAARKAETIWTLTGVPPTPGAVAEVRREAAAVPEIDERLDDPEEELRRHEPLAFMLKHGELLRDMENRVATALDSMKERQADLLASRELVEYLNREIGSAMRNVLGSSERLMTSPLNSGQLRYVQAIRTAASSLLERTDPASPSVLNRAARDGLDAGAAPTGLHPRAGKSTRMARKCERDISDLLGKLRGALARGELEKVRPELGNLKSVLESMGISGLVRRAGDLERDAAQPDGGFAEKTAIFLDDVQVFSDKLLLVRGER